MIIKRIPYNYGGKEVEVIKTATEVTEVLITSVMMAKVVGVLSKEDVMLLAYVYDDTERYSDLSSMYGESGIIAEFVKDGIKAIGDNLTSQGIITAMELSLSPKGNVSSVKINFDSGKTVSFEKLSQPVLNIISRLK